MTARPTFPSGHEPSPDEFSFLVPLAGYKTSDTSRSNTATLANDPDLLITPPVSTVWAIQGVLIIEGGSVGDMKIAFSFPTGATLTWGLIDNPTGITTPYTSNTVFTGAFGSATSGSSFFSAGLIGAGSQFYTPVGGLLTMGSTAGNLTVQWAQNTSDGTAATMKAGSWLMGWRLA